MISRIVLRKALRSDSAALLAWRNDATTRKNSLSTDLVTTDVHATWFARVLKSKEHTLLIATMDGRRVGQVRFDRLDQKLYRISITVAPEMREQGIGKYMLAAADEYARTHAFGRIYATIKKDNIASQKIFQRSGYRLFEKGRQTMTFLNRLDVRKIGIKMWSSNAQSYPALASLYCEGIIDYVELYIIPGSFNEKLLVPLKDIPLIFHAPHTSHQFSLSRKDSHYRETISTIRKYVDYFKENRIIFHPPDLRRNERGELHKTILALRDLSSWLDIIIETMPRQGIHGSRMLGADPAQFARMVKSMHAKVCLDFGHTFAAANFYKKEPISFVKQFLAFRPFMYHVADNDAASSVDGHLNLGDGSLPLKKLLGFVNPPAYVSLETPKKDFVALSEDLENLRLLQKLFKARV
jgi:RimJ/RimL family protein N-acetyltransferase/endonuclease IV